MRAKQIIKGIAPCSYKRVVQTQSDKAMTSNSDLVIEEEKAEVDSLSNQLMQTQLTSPSQQNEQVSKTKQKAKWTQLFKKVRFFAQYEHFIKIDILSNDTSSHQKWLGYIESQIRRLFQLFADIESIQDLRIYPRIFKREETKDTLNHAFVCCDSYFIGIRLNETQPGASINLREQVKDFCNWLEIGRVKKMLNNVRILHFKKSELPPELIHNF